MRGKHHQPVACRTSVPTRASVPLSDTLRNATPSGKGQNANVHSNPRREHHLLPVKLPRYKLLIEVCGGISGALTPRHQPTSRKSHTVIGFPSKFGPHAHAMHCADKLLGDAGACLARRKQDTLPETHAWEASTVCTSTTCRLPQAPGPTPLHNARKRLGLCSTAAVAALTRALGVVRCHGIPPSMPDRATATATARARARRQTPPLTARAMGGASCAKMAFAAALILVTACADGAQLQI